ncbi:SRPBCC domain-containing protein [Ideonella sp. DXS29W]|uniref:SRPBCC domain-containing protein n=1 Tax=Ideonella lacteola TaxID=2984193 RepID=A0ABU9BZI3_9BURK
MVSRKQIQFSTFIAAPVSTVFRTMIEPGSYRQWAAAFMEGSTFEGTWQAGERIRFVGPEGDGMLSEIAANRPDEFISIRHLGFVTKGVEDTTSDAARAWAGACENYSFAAVPGGTQLTVDQDVVAEFEGYLSEAWPKALAKLKALSESQ